MTKVKQVAINTGVWLLTWLILPLGAVILYGAYVVSLGRARRVLAAANILADAFFCLMVLYIMSDYITIKERGDTWLKE